MEAEFRIVERSIGDMLDERAGEAPDLVRWHIDDEETTYAQVRDRTDEVAKSLLALGVQSGDVVAVWIPNRPEFMHCLFACAKVGAILVCINTRFKGFELTHILRHSKARFLLMVDRFLGNEFAATLASVAPSLAPRADGAVTSAEFPALQYLIHFSPEPTVQAGISYADFHSRGDALDGGELERSQRQQDWRNPVLLQYTSGTTSLPKGALIDHRYLLHMSAEIVHRLGARPGESFLNTQPFYHAGGAGSVTIPLVLDCAVVSTEYYDPERILGLIEKKRCEIRSGHSAMYLMELNHPRFKEFDLSSLRSGWCIGTPALMQRVRDEMKMPYVSQIYGATEAGGTGGHWSDPWDTCARTAGKPLAGTEVNIFDAQTNVRVPAGIVGEIRTRGWWQMVGYLGQPEETARAIDPEGWWHSGDLGKLDDDGNLIFVGRLKEMLRVGGENVAPEEVETVLLTHPAIAQVGVIGAPDARLGEVVLCVIETRAGKSVTQDEVIRYCKERMANFRVPRHVVFTRTWPMTGSGKIQRNRLREGIPAVASYFETLEKEKTAE